MRCSIIGMEFGCISSQDGALAAFLPMLALGGGGSWFLNVGGLLFVVLGEIALLLAGFKLRDIAEAFRCAAGRAVADGGTCRPSRIFESIARNALALGVLAALVGFVQSVQSFNGAMAQFFALLARILQPALYGIVLATLFGVAGTALYEREANSQFDLRGGEATSRKGQSGAAASRWLGYALMVGLLLWLMRPLSGGQGSGYWLAEWRAWLTVVGAAAFLALIHGSIESGRGATLGFVCSGLICGFWGLLRTLHAFAGGSIGPVAAGIGFMMTTWIAALSGMVLVGFPLEDRAAGDRDPGAVMRTIWYVVPFVALIMLAIVFLLIVTPIEKSVAG